MGIPKKQSSPNAKLWPVLLLLFALFSVVGASAQSGRLFNLYDDSVQAVKVIVGPRGPAGIAGTNGTNGLDGVNGVIGKDGAPGPAGSNGAAGANGAQGVPGSNDCISGICVSRQSTTPGTQETGNINIDGKILASQVGVNVTPTNTLSVGGTANFGGHTATGAGATVNGITSASDAISGATAHNTIAAVYETVTTLDEASTMYEGLGGVLKLNPSAAPVFGQIIGNNGGVEVVSGNAEDFGGSIQGMNGSFIHAGTGTVGSAVALQGPFLNLSIGTVTNGYGIRSIGINLNPGGSSGTITNYIGIDSSFAINMGTITNFRGIQIQTPTNAGTIANNYGLYIQDQSSVGSSNSYNIYSAGSTAKNFFEGLVGIGATNPSAKLEFASATTATGGISFGGDTTLYRNGANSLVTDGAFTGADIFGGTRLGAGSYFTGAKLNVGTGSAGSIGAIIRGASSQTANLQEWQNSAGTALAFISAAGDLRAATATITGAVQASTSLYLGTDNVYESTDSGVYLSPRASGWSLINRGNASNVNLKIKGMAAQSGNLTEWQNSSGTILSAVDASGTFKILPGQTAVNGLTFYDNNFAIGMSSTDLALTTVSGSSNGISFTNSGVGGTPLMRIRGDGKIGIGTSSPNTKLQIISDSSTTETFGGTQNGNPGLIISSNTYAPNNIPVGVEFGMGGGGYTFGGLYGVGSSASGNTAGDLVFATRRLTSDTTFTRALTIEGTSGNVGIGDDTTPDSRLDVSNTSTAGSVLQLTNSAGSCDHTPTAGAETVSCSSDERLKTNITDAASVLSEINGLKIHDYTVIASGQQTTGLIAQEVINTNPEMVHMGEDGYYKVDSYNPWKVLKGIQELSTNADDLQTTFTTALEKTNGDLSATNEILAALGLRVDDLSDKLEEFATRLSEHDDRLNAQETRIQSLEAEIQALKQQFNTSSASPPSN